MGKTKTAFIAEVQDENKSSQDAYKEKKVRQAKEAAARAGVKESATKKDEEKKIHIPGLKGGQRVKIVEAESLPEVAEILSDTDTKTQKKTAKEPKIRSKKYLEQKSKVTPGRAYALADAIKLAQETSYSSFDGTIELHLMVKKTGTTAQVVLPHAAGKEKKIEVATDATIEKLKTGKVDFDVLLATPDMMPKLVVFAKILGPRGMMPNPKNGTLLSTIAKAKNFSANSRSIKTEKEAPLIHTAIGKVSQKTEELVENAEVILIALGGNKQVIKAFAKASMGPSVRIQIA